MWKPAKNWFFLVLDILDFAHLNFSLKISCHSTPTFYLEAICINTCIYKMPYKVHSNEGQKKEKAQFPVH